MDVLDQRQAELIEAVHRGFLYQHLFAVGCLLLAPKMNTTSVIVERDEDIEIVGSEKIYIQVKTRSEFIKPSDIKLTLERFESLRKEHESGRRVGKVY